VSRQRRTRSNRANIAFFAVLALLSLGATGLLFRLLRDFESGIENQVRDLRRVFSDVNLLRLPDQPQISFSEVEAEVAKYENHGVFQEITITKFHGAEDRIVYPFFLPAMVSSSGWRLPQPEGFHHPLPWSNDPEVRVLPLQSESARLGTLYVRVDTGTLGTVRALIASLLGVFATSFGLFLLQFRRQERTISRTAIELEEKRRELVRLERLALAGQLSANIFHDLKKPVLNIKHEVEELEESSPATEATADRMREQVDLFFGILRDGSLDRFVRAQEDVQFVDVNEMISRSLALVRYERGDVDVETQLDDRLPPIFAEPVRLIQVFSNLILNAYQAMGRKGNLVVTTRLSEHQIVVAIQDDGPGIPAEKQGAVFEPFFSTKPASEGTGLGLYIVRQIVDDFGGAITLASEQGRTVFTVTLPIAEQPLAQP